LSANLTRKYRNSLSSSFRMPIRVPEQRAPPVAKRGHGSLRPPLGATDAFSLLVSKHLMRREFVVLLLLLAGTACQKQSDTPPPPPPPPGAGEQHNEGFPIKPRPGCASNVIASVEKSDLAEIKRLAAGGAVFTCGPADSPPPLDEAVMRDEPALVLALLEAHADPTARWSSHGDRFPLQEVLEIQSYGRRSTHREQIMRVLLSHGADPNQRVVSV
jgi:hypothetical protein